MARVDKKAQSSVLVGCQSCRQELPLESFRVFSQAPLRFYDFCTSCESVHGVRPLYQKHASIATEAVRKYVLEGEDILNANIDARAAESRDRTKGEFARRELARRRLIYFIKRFFPGYKVGWLHNDICRRLEKFMVEVEQGRSPRLVLNVPPRHGKSAVASDYYPSWVFGHHPDWEIIATSYALTLPTEFSRNIRARMRDPAYKALFPETELAPDSQAVEAWKTTRKGAFTCAGVGGPILGKGAHILIIDDPHKNQEEASSETLRETAQRWYSSTARTRLHPGGGVLIIQQRWHDDDLTGHQLTLERELLEQGVPPEEIDRWEVVTYPALAEEDEYLFPNGEIVRSPDVNTMPAEARLLRKVGEALHPARYTRAMLLQQKNASPKDEWNALYQQNPVPDDGEFFSRYDIRMLGPDLPGHTDDYTFVTAWDFAIGEKQRNDWTVGTVGAINIRGELLIVDMIRGRFGTNQIIDSIMAFVDKYPLHMLGMEHGQIMMTLKPLIEEQLRKRRGSSVTFSEDLKPVTDKQVRAQPLRAMVQRGQFYVLNQPWAEKMIGEMLRFPKGSHDDIVDSLAWLARIARLAPLPTQGFTPARRQSWKERINGTNRRSGPDSFMTA